MGTGQASSPSERIAGRTRRRTQLRRRRAAWLVVIGVLAVAVVAAVMFVTANVPTRMAADTQLTLTADGRSATMTVPQKWSARDAWFASDHATITTPDGVVTMTVVLASADRDAAYDTASSDRTLELEPPRHERLASGLDAVHGEGRDKSGRVIVAAVGAAGSDTSVVVVASMAPPSGYRAEMVAILESIRVTG